MDRRSLGWAPALPALILTVAGLACGLPAQGPTTDEIVVEPTIAPTLPAAPTQPAAAIEEPADPASDAFRDEFDGALDPDWTWPQGDPGGWSLTDAPGWLRLPLSTESFIASSPPGSLLVRAAPEGDFDLRARLRFTPTRNFEIAGLVVLFDDGTVLQLGQAYCQGGDPATCIGEALYFDNIHPGGPSIPNFATADLPRGDVVLRILRQGTGYAGAIQVEENIFVTVGTHEVAARPVSVGLVAAQAPDAGPYAEFDWIEWRPFP